MHKEILHKKYMPYLFILYKKINHIATILTKKVALFCATCYEW